MDLSSYLGKIARDVNWIANAMKKGELKDLPLDNVQIAHVEGQVRQAGTINSHIAALEDDIARRGQQVPITVEEIPEKPGFYSATDGNHRLKALRNLHASSDEEAAVKYFSVRAHVVRFDSDYERMSYQMKANDHLPARQSTVDDVAHIVQKIMNCQCPNTPSELQGGSGNKKYLADPEGYQAVLEGYLEETTSLKSKDRKAVSSKVMKGFPNQKLRNFDNKELIREFSANNPIGWEAPKNGRVFNGWRIEVLLRASNVFPNVCGNTYKAKTDDASIKTAVVVCDSNPFGKTGSKLDEYRRSVISKINELNSSSLLKDDITLVDKIFLAPQKIGSEIQEKGFYEIDVVEGTFGADAFPANGW